MIVTANFMQISKGQINEYKFYGKKIGKKFENIKISGIPINNTGEKFLL